MSAFLGPIHHWLFQKIRFQDDLTSAIIYKAADGEKAEALKLQLNSRYPELEGGQLEDLIDGGNIHGWLQERISLVENRLAFVVTALQQENPYFSRELAAASYEFGKAHPIESGISTREAYDYLENILLNGMPCDRVNEITHETPETLRWIETIDIHARYWEANEGDVDLNQVIRENLIRGILEGSGVEYHPINHKAFELRKAA